MVTMVLLQHPLCPLIVKVHIPQPLCPLIVVTSSQHRAISSRPLSTDRNSQSEAPPVVTAPTSSASSSQTDLSQEPSTSQDQCTEVSSKVPSQVAAKKVKSKKVSSETSESEHENEKDIFNNSRSDTMSDELGDKCEDLRLGIETVNKRNEIRRNFNQKVTLSYKSPDAKIVDRYMGQTERNSKLPEEIRETFLMEGAGAYQGGEKENTGQTKKLSEIFKKQKKSDEKIPQNSK